MMVADPEPALPLATLVAELAPFSAELSHGGALRVRDVVQDSRRVCGGELFVARDGARSSAGTNAEQAIARGAVAVMTEVGAAVGAVTVPVLTVRDLRRAIGFAAEAVHRHPTRALGVVGITGTNGKTTCSFLAAHAIDGSGGRAARLGTLGLGFEALERPSPLTTPEADEVSRVAAEVQRLGATHLVMEASSHALALGRVEAVCFRVAAFSNLSQDHLDFHGSMDEYASAKLRLFTELSPAVSVVNVDDEFGRRIVDQARGPVLRVSRRGRGDVSVGAARAAGALFALPVEVAGARHELLTRLVGTHNLDNIALSLGIVLGLGLDVAAAVRSFASAPSAPGRLERCDTDADDVVVLVDYAHTPDALERALGAVRDLSTGTLWCVFGCGGDRDPSKRPKMGDAVGRGADRAIVTNDNPRSEAPQAIADAILVGLTSHRKPLEVILDRERAIEHAVCNAAPGDVVLVAGKGHETLQIIGDERREFDDRVSARRALARRRARGES
ncbi:MAG: UDP-N-acetylmuramoyl-L-alanyl-D-glutamate--2,6-diaminopimelate ligase [Polyangiaceae bacterium]|nr:UDP-N-acetylmuramoyl-L-alanyl-D-glutamate--2,6-diaminopimelate ligase [Polyangiaceae bacterium]